MAQAMTLSVVQQQGYPVVGSAIPPVSIADTAFTTAIVHTGPTTIGFNVTRLRAVVYLKTLVLGNNTGTLQGPCFYLRGATNVNMTTGLVHLSGVKAAPNIASSTAGSTIILEGVVPTNAGVGFVDVTCDPTLMGAGAPSGTFDVVITFNP